MENKFCDGRLKMSFELRIIAAYSDNRVIGKNGHIPFNFKADKNRFAKRTEGKPIIMGRLTYKSIGRVLPNRYNIILSSNHSYEVEGAYCATCFDEAVEAARADFESEEEVAYVVGGERVYRRTLESQLLTRLELTEVHIDVDIKDGDKVTYFPEFGPEWVVERREEGTYTRNKGGVMVPYSFVDYVR